VVERPASVVKELVENALDAGARRIDVEIEDGGLSLVKVADDGEGMDAADARLAFERHATSKLVHPDDLAGVTTFGFRGEALPSIGSVSRVRLLTGREDSGEGTEVTWEGGRLVGVRPGPARTGTVVWVRDLFFNTPARRRAMRSPSAEAARVSEVLASAALAAPGVAVSLTSDGRFAWATPGTGRVEDAAAGVFGGGFVRDMVTVDRTTGEVRVRGLVGLPRVSRRDGRRQYLSCNGRPIAPQLLRRAVEGAYTGLLESGRTPVFVLDVRLAAGEVDVNLHPAKTFIRFRDHGSVHRAVAAAVSQALAGADLMASGLASAARRDGRRGSHGFAGTRPDFRPDLWGPADDALWAAGTTGGRPPGGVGEGSTPFHPQETTGGAVTPEAASTGRRLTRDPGETVLPVLEPLGQVAETFIVARGPDGLYVVDQHAAHERIIYERLLSRLTGGREEIAAGRDGEDGPVASPSSQILTVPVTLDLAPGEAEAVSRSLGFLRAVGFDLESFGGRTVVIRAVPAPLTGVSPARLVTDFLDRLDEEERSCPGPSARRGLEVGFDEARALRAMAACRAALKAGEPLAPETMLALLQDLAATTEPRTCPHGRPTVLRIGLEDLRREFSR
jgi:DNA mismatch repair protein MutL